MASCTICARMMSGVPVEAELGLFDSAAPAYLCSHCDVPQEPSSWDLSLPALMHSLLCNVCSTAWPKVDLYRQCPRCELSTKPSIERPIARGDAESLANEAAFDHWCYEHDRI